jgi:predicted HTH domain antitoxin
MLPDARDGLTRLQRVILWQLREAQRELSRESVPTALLYGRVIEYCDCSVDEFQRELQRLGALRLG